MVADTWPRDRLSGLAFAFGDAVAAKGGVSEPARHGLRPDALTGILSCSPMAAEEAFARTEVCKLRKGDPSDPAEANGLAMRAFASAMVAA